MKPLMIWKFDARIRPTFELEMPKDARILHVALQHDPQAPQLWALVDVNAEKVVRRFAYWGTGHVIPDNLNLVYVGTVLIDRNTLVFHLFEVLE